CSMGTLIVVWRNSAADFLEQTSNWYRINMGYNAALHFIQGIHNTVKTLSHSPQIGVIDERHSTVRTKYYSFLSHPKYRITYRFTTTTLYIVAIRATIMAK
ncbi:MAG: type II toxin-antitoxin system RelE/ParE family toxin, partial [Bacteroides sp.]